MVAEIIFKDTTIAVVKEGDVLRCGDTLIIDNVKYNLEDRQIFTDSAFLYDKSGRYKTITRIKFKAFKCYDNPVNK